MTDAAKSIDLHTARERTNAWRLSRRARLLPPVILDRQNRRRNLVLQQVATGIPAIDERPMRLKQGWK
jgi:hypothetical protein